VALIALVVAIAVVAVAVTVIVLEDARLGGRTAARPPAEPGPMRRAAATRSHQLGAWIAHHGGDAWAACVQARAAAGARARAEMARHARPRPEWLRKWSARWAAIDARAQALVEEHTPLRRPDQPVARRSDPARRAVDLADAPAAAPPDHPRPEHQRVA
jgi:hypothetical protein